MKDMEQRIQEVNIIVDGVVGAIRAKLHPGSPLLLPEQLNELVNRMRVRHYFPQLPLSQQILVMALCNIKQALTLLIQCDQRDFTLDLKKDWDQVTYTVEQEYMNCISMIKNKIKFEELPILQQNIFNREYATIYFDEGQLNRQ